MIDTDRLAERGAAVTLLERGGPAYGTTGSSFAWINSNSKLPHDYFALVSEHFEGETADSWIVANGPMAADAALRVGLQVVRAIGAAAFHSRLWLFSTRATAWIRAAITFY